jgi:S-adenosylmethionine:tRNA ribosyltransferase-isomerase
MRVDTFQYELPAELIAQHPPPERDLARLLVVPTGSAQVSHRKVSDLPDILERGSLLVVNDTRVIPARLLGRKRTGGRVEWLLVRRMGTRAMGGAGGDAREAEVWQAIGRGLGPTEPGSTFEVASRDASDAGVTAPLRITLVERLSEDGLLEVLLWTAGGEPVGEQLEACGHVPLPPYIKRTDVVEDAARYQTVYARNAGAIAAPTAGLHLTPGILDRLVARGCEVASVTLHVGLGTFQPVQADDLDQHSMHAEDFALPEPTVAAIARARARGAPVVAVGTTTVRALESAADSERPGYVRAMSGETRILIQPGHPWRVVDALLTNFHQPRSTLMALVCAFGGTERLLDAYQVAIRERYRFFSYGDAMLLWRAV